jgi:hypothetical protein
VNVPTARRTARTKFRQAKRPPPLRSAKKNELQRFLPVRFRDSLELWVEDAPHPRDVNAEITSKKATL